MCVRRALEAAPHLERGGAVPRGDVPQPYRLVRAAAGKQLAVAARERHRVDLAAARAGLAEGAGGGYGL